ncbi:ISL3 family transposase [Chitinophaga sp. LS1]|uniref:ISL3 family transposase n=1 Tax=Chitinophaga sp. LS1 TaxID=3051176 RepID=UPI002AAB50C8|nr:ISL3 family transposase [Chitinophaga sp. LS1]WPV69647.1 ISL3 family transposase [Chitinophaga sp. LS1]
MNSKNLIFERSEAFNIKSIIQVQNIVYLNVESRLKTAKCPNCQRKSGSIHSYYYRKIKDLPSFGKQVCINLLTRKFYCKNNNCEKKIFSQRFNEQFKPYSRMSERLAAILLKTGLLTGGNAGARLCKLHNVSVSASTILRNIHKAPIIKPETPQVLGIDDWAYKKQHRYGTVLVDMEKHKIIELLPDREAATIQKWLQDNPGVKIVSRDRFSNYANGVRNGSPEAIQVADRFHLLQNLSESLKKLLVRHYKTYKGIIKQKDEEKLDGNITVLAPADLPRQITPSYYNRQCQMDEIKSRHANGESIRSIASLMKISREKVTNFLRLQEPPIRLSPNQFSFTKYADLIKKSIIANPRITSSKIIIELKNSGYNGGKTAVYNFIKNCVRIKPNADQEELPRQLWSPNKASLLLSKPASLLNEIENKVVNALCKSVSDIERSCLLSRQFRRMIIKRKGERLNNWVNKALKSGVKEMISFANSLLSDFDAVKCLIRRSLGQPQRSIPGQSKR